MERAPEEGMEVIDYTHLENNFPSGGYPEDRSNHLRRRTVASEVGVVVECGRSPSKEINKRL
jgi:hypothetical protein